MGADLYIKKIYKKTEKKYRPLFKVACNTRDSYEQMYKEHGYTEKEIFEKTRKFQKEVEKYYNLMYSKGYFRDCYNSYGLFAFINANTNLNLSWWELRDNEKWFNKKGEMKLSGVKEFVGMIEQAKLEIGIREKYGEKYKSGFKIKEYLGDGKYKSKKAKQKEVKYFKEWLNELIAFLKLAIKEKEPIEWSV